MPASEHNALLLRWGVHVSLLLVTAVAVLFFEQGHSTSLSRKMVSSIIFPVRLICRPLPCLLSSSLVHPHLVLLAPVLCSGVSVETNLEFQARYRLKLVVAAQTWFLWVWSMSPSAPRAFSTCLYCTSWFLLGFLFHTWIK
jgi:hypothetical protein